MSKDLCLNENGILAYNYDEIKFQNLLNDEIETPTQKGSIHVKHNLKSSKLLRSQIVNINLNLFLANPIEYMNKFLTHCG